MKNSRRHRTGRGSLANQRAFEARWVVLGILSVPSRASTTPGQRDAPRSARPTPTLRVHRCRSKVRPKELGACELWLNQMPNPGAIAYGTVSGQSSRILLGPW